MSVRNLYGVVLLVIFCGLEATKIQFRHNMKLDDEYHMHWTFDDEYITVKVVVNTTGITSRFLYIINVYQSLLSILR